MKIQRAILSVSNKEGIVELARFLHEKGVQLISTGGTMQTIKEAGIPVTYVSEVTGFPEVMDGRVKTLNPFVHGGILAVRDNAQHVKQMAEHGIKPIDMVVVNLYPFRETIAKTGVTEAEAVENIDIGGPAMIRAAAKNFQHVAVVVNPASYQKLMQELQEREELSFAFKKALAEEAFRHTSEYDAAIAAYLAKTLMPEEEYPAEKVFFLEKIQNLRYGENPHQTAAFYRDKESTGGVAAAEQLHGKELSFNNILDVEAAYRIASDFEQPAAAIIKHTNPCGVGIGKNLAEAYGKAYEADPVSAYGGIIGLNRVVDKESAEKISSLFVEAIIAPGYEKAALEILQEKKNIRLLQLPLLQLQNEYDVKKVSGGFVLQSFDTAFAPQEEMQVMTKRKPTQEEWQQLLFALKVVKHVKSNAILLARDYRTIGVGAGQMNRVGAAEIAIKQAGELATGSVLASDAFFPFADTVKVAAQAGIKAIIQPGGSVRDKESIEAADKYGIAMVFSGLRHFKH